MLNSDPLAQPARAPTIVLVLTRLHRQRRWAGWWWFITAARRFSAVPGLLWAKALGSGYEGGFGLRPSLDQHGYLAVFDSPEAARAYRDGAFVAACTALSRELAWIELRPVSSRGRWSGHEIPVASVEAKPVDPSPAVPLSPLPQGPAASGQVPEPATGACVVALTRASIRLSRAWRFWRHAPPSQRSLEQTPGCLMAVGLGEAPLLRQATFSVWRSEADLRAYAHAGAHRRAIEAAYGEGYFSESLFARFTPVAAGGYWQGAPVSERLLGTAAGPGTPPSAPSPAPGTRPVPVDPSPSSWGVGRA